MCRYELNRAGMCSAAQGKYFSERAPLFGGTINALKRQVFDRDNLEFRKIQKIKNRKYRIVFNVNCSFFGIEIFSWTLSCGPERDQS
jgi:hypothetical protein